MPRCGNFVVVCKWSVENFVYTFIACFEISPGLRIYTLLRCQYSSGWVGKSIWPEFRKSSSSGLNSMFCLFVFFQLSKYNSWTLVRCRHFLWLFVRRRNGSMQLALMGSDGMCKVAAANIPSSLVAAESTLIFTCPAELIPCIREIIVKDGYCSWWKMNIESQSGLEPGISEFQSDTLLH